MKRQTTGDERMQQSVKQFLVEFAKEVGFDHYGAIGIAEVVFARYMDESITPAVSTAMCDDIRKAAEQQREQ